MYNKTTTVKTTPYFDVMERSNITKEMNMKLVTDIAYQSTQLNYCNEPVMLEAQKGIVALIVTAGINKKVESYILHGIIQMQPNTFFTLLRVTDDASYNIQSVELKSIIYPSTLQINSIRERLFLPRIYASYYQIKKAPYYFAHDSHLYWELTVVESGTLKTEIDGITYTLEKNQAIYYGPSQIHTQQVDEGVCTYLTFMFEIYPIHPRLYNRVFTLKSKQVRLLQKIIDYSDSLEKDLYTEFYINHLKEFVLHTLTIDEKTEVVSSNAPRFNYDDEMMNKVLEFIEANLYGQLQVATICKEIGLSRATVQNLFKKQFNLTPKAYINHLRLKESKILINQYKYTFSEIADLLGYANIHYFSRSFKREFGITPSDYAKSLVKK